jgi:hypothetical protein
VPSERDAVAAALENAEREGKSLAQAIRKGGELESLRRSEQSYRVGGSA